MPTTWLVEFFLGGASVAAPSAPARVARYRWRDDASAALRWADDAAAALRWRDESGLALRWSDDMASLNHLSQHVGSAKRFTFTPTTLRAGVNPYAGVQPRVTVCDRPGDFLSDSPPTILLRKTTGLSVDAATGVVTWDSPPADTLAVRAAGGLGSFYYFLEDIAAATPLVISHGEFSLEPSALDAP